MTHEDILRDLDYEITFRASIRARYRLAKRLYGGQDGYGWRIFVYYLLACFVMQLTVHVHMPVPYWVSYAGWFAVLVGLMLISAGQRLSDQSQALKGRPGVLKKEGIYHYSRHPMYLGFVLVPFGLGLAQDLFWFLMMSVPMAFLFQFHVIPNEEVRLIKKWGAEYKAYMKKVPRWL